MMFPRWFKHFDCWRLSTDFTLVQYRCDVIWFAPRVSILTSFIAKSYDWSEFDGVLFSMFRLQFCREDSIHSYQECLFNRVIPEYKVYEGGQLTYCRHMDVATLKVSRSQKNPFRPYFTCRRKEMCRFFQWADKLPVDFLQTQSPVYFPKDDVTSQLDTTKWIIPRTKLQRQFAVSENWHPWTVTFSYNNNEHYFCFI